MNVTEGGRRAHWEWAFPRRPKQRTYVFVSWGKWWKGVYLNSRLGTLRLFLWGWDWRKRHRGGLGLTSITGMER